MGCTNCSSKTGCDDRKGTMFEQIERALARLYPSKRWGEPDDAERVGAGICAHEGMALADQLADTLRAFSVFVPGADDEYCDYIYILCVGRAPCLVQVRDGDVPVPQEITADVPISELYLRVCLSNMVRMAGVQQVSMELSGTQDGWSLTEAARPGVYDPPLLNRFQNLVAELVGHDITHLDFGEISAAPVGFDPGDYAALYGGEPHTANYLFFPQPSTMRTTTFVSGHVSQ